MSLLFSGEEQDFPCATYPCQNGGICKAIGADYECECPTFYRGKNCEQDLGKYMKLNSLRAVKHSRRPQNSRLIFFN